MTEKILKLKEVNQKDSLGDDSEQDEDNELGSNV